MQHDAALQPPQAIDLVTTLRTSPDILILTFLFERTQATAAEIQAACRLSPGEVRSRLAHLESLRHVMSRTDTRLVPPARVFILTGEGRRKVGRT